MQPNTRCRKLHGHISYSAELAGLIRCVTALGVLRGSHTAIGDRTLRICVIL